MAYSITAAVKTLDQVQGSQSAKRTQSAKNRKSDANEKDSFGQALRDASSAYSSNDTSGPDDAKVSGKEAEGSVGETAEAVSETAKTVVVWSMEQQGLNQMQGTLQQDISESSALEMAGVVDQGQAQGTFGDGLVEAGGLTQASIGKEDNFLNSEDALGQQGVPGDTEISGNEMKAVSVNPEEDGAWKALPKNENQNGEQIARTEINPDAEGKVRHISDAPKGEHMDFGRNPGERESAVSLRETKGAKQDGEEHQILDASAEAFADRLNNHTMSMQRTDAVSDTQPHINEAGEMQEEYADMLKDLIARQVSNGKQELEISLTPRSLGNMLVRIAYEAGETSISIICSNPKAMHAMSQKAGELGRILEESLGAKMEVVVETKEPESYFNQDGRNGSGAQEQQERQQERAAEHRRFKEQAESGTDFLHQLRLGLAD